MAGDHNDLSGSPLLALESEIKRSLSLGTMTSSQPQNYQDQRDEMGPGGGVSFPPGHQNERDHASFS